MAPMAGVNRPGVRFFLLCSAVGGGVNLSLWSLFLFAPHSRAGDFAFTLLRDWDPGKYLVRWIEVGVLVAIFGGRIPAFAYVTVVMIVFSLECAVVCSVVAALLGRRS